MNTFTPEGCETSVRFTQLIRQHDTSVAELSSTRLIKLASHLPAGEYLGWQVLLPPVGLASVEAFGTESVRSADLTWAFQTLAAAEEPEAPAEASASPDWALPQDACLYEILSGSCEDTSSALGFGAAAAPAASDLVCKKLPSGISLQFPAFAEALREEGGLLRFTAASASEQEQARCRSKVLAHWVPSRVDPETYLGTPVRAAAFLLLPDKASLRLRTAVSQAISGASLRLIGRMHDPSVSAYLADPLFGLRTMPEFTARALMLEPFVRDETVMGIHCREPLVPLIPATHPETVSGRHITIGKALDSSGLTRDITLCEEDLKRHWQIIGQTGTGKSTLLATSILSAIEQGFGLTFFDPHGSTIDLILRSLPAQYAGKVRVVRIGDEDHPVPLNVFHSDDPVAEERTISDLNLLFSDMFDPKREGFVGPRWERWFSTFASAAIALFGKRASFEAITLLSQGRANMRKAYDRLKGKYPALADTIQEEFGKVSDSDFNNLIGWTLCKMQRLTSVPQLRNTLGAGANALDFESLLENDMVTLIDLASPSIGTHAARTIGTLLLMQLWNAALDRGIHSRTHLVFIDEAHLFQTNPLPQMLAESRKFSLGIVLAHQHCGQLTQEILEALEANSASFSAFRLSARDSIRAAMRFGDQAMEKKLPAMNAFQAVTTLSTGGLQTDPFTLQIFPVPEEPQGNEIARRIEEASIATLVTPYASRRPLTRDEMLSFLEDKPKDKPKKDKAANSTEEEADLQEYYDSDDAVTPLASLLDPLPDLSLAPAWHTEWVQAKRVDKASGKKKGRQKKAG